MVGNRQEARLLVYSQHLVRLVGVVAERCQKILLVEEVVENWGCLMTVGLTGAGHLAVAGSHLKWTEPPMRPLKAGMPQQARAFSWIFLFME